MGLCRTCKHWNAGPWATIDPRRVDVGGYRTCGKLAEVLDIDLDQGRGYGSGGASIERIDTLPGWGCMSHEPWSPPPTPKPDTTESER